MSYKIIGLAIEVHRHLGPGLLESAYEECLCYESSRDNLNFERQKPLPIVYKGIKLDCGYKLDIVVEHYGKINAEVTINDIVTSVGTGDLQTVVYDLTAMKIWVANARADDESGPLDAFNRQFVEFDMNTLFKKARELVIR